MDCPSCTIGEVFLDIDRAQDRARLVCGGAIGPGTSCGWSGYPMTADEADALVTHQCEVLRGTVLTILDWVAAVQ